MKAINSAKPAHLTVPATWILVLTLGLAIGQTACKTRAQLKGDQDQGDAAAGNESGVQPKPANYEFDEVKNEVTRISGRLEEIDHAQRGQPNATELKDYMAKLDGRVAELEKNQMLVMTELKTFKDKQSADDAAARVAATPPTDLLTRGNQLVSEKKCDEATETFKQLLGHPGLKPKDLADAHFGMGEAEYCRKDYKKAILEFSAVRKAYAKSSKIPSSLYRIALSFSHLNMQEESNGFFKEIVDKYPNSPEAKKAKARVKE